MKIYADGAGWNGKVSRIAVVFSDGEEEVRESDEPRTNNEAEYYAVIRACILADRNDTVLTDSMLVFSQANRKFKIHTERLRPLCNKVRKLMKEKDLEIKWVARRGNKAGKLLEKISARNKA
jgi:ribonuclease HI